MATQEVVRQIHEALATTLSPIDEQRKPAEEFLRKNEVVTFDLLFVNPA